jgi:hypothetical protein
MSQHIISTTIINTPSGTPASDNGVCALVCKAVTISTTFVCDTWYLLTKASDLATLGVTAATDLAGHVNVYKQVTDFYAQAGDGAKLWLCGMSLATAFKDYVATSTFKNGIRGTALTDPLNRVKMIGLCFETPLIGQLATDFPTTVTDILTPLQATQVALFAEGFPVSFIVDGYNMSSTITPTTLTTMATRSCPSISFCITGNDESGVSAVGLALGRLARITVGHGFGAVEDGPMNTNYAYLTNGINVDYLTTDTLVLGKVYTVVGGAITYNSVSKSVGDTVTCVTDHYTFTTSAGGRLNYHVAATDVSKMFVADINLLGTKQFMFLRTWFDKSGYYWNDGATCEVETKPLSTIEFNRVGNYLSSAALGFFINEMGKNLPLNKATGAVDDGYLKTKEAEFYHTYIAPLTVADGSGDITDGSMVLTGPDFNETKTMYFAITIVPTPIMGNAIGTIEFSATL